MVIPTQTGAHDQMRGLFPEWDEGFEVRRPEVSTAEEEEQQTGDCNRTASSLPNRH